MKEKPAAPQGNSSFIGGRKEGVPMRDVTAWLKDSKRYPELKMTEAERMAIGEKITKNGGHYLDPKELKHMKDQLALGKWGAYKDMPKEQKEGMKKIIDAMTKESRN